jgi:hypothetical protein
MTRQQEARSLKSVRALTISLGGVSLLCAFLAFSSLMEDGGQNVVEFGATSLGLGAVAGFLAWWQGRKSDDGLSGE